MLGMIRLLRELEEEIKEKMKNPEGYALAMPLLRTKGDTTCVAVIMLKLVGDPKAKEWCERPVMYFEYSLDGTVRQMAPVPTKLYGNRFPEDKPYHYNPKKLSLETYDEMYRQFDSARQALLEHPDKDYYRDYYKTYMDAILATVDKDMRDFYRLISNPPEIKKTEESKKAPEAFETTALPAEEKREAKKEPAPEPKETAHREKKEQKPEPETKAESEQKPAKLFWEPQINLSTMPEMTYRMHEELAEHIEFLENKEENQLRIAYPLFCFEKDRKNEGGAMQELLYRLKIKDFPMGHMRIGAKPSVYANCKNAKDGCLFSACPYILAAYIKYLKENAPDVLKKQRDTYQRNKEQIDAKNLKAIPFLIGVPEQVDTEPMVQGAQLLRSGRFELECSDALVATWRENPDDAPKRVRILPKALEEHTGAFLDENGTPVPADVYCAILAYDSMTRKVPKQAPAPKPAPAKKEMAPQTKGTEKAEKKKENRTDLSDYMAEDGAFYKAITNPEIKTVYGIYETPVPVTENDGFVKAVRQALKEKGFTEAEILKGTSNAIPRNGKINFVSLNGPAEFKTDYFSQKAAVILCGRKADIEKVLQDPEAKMLYGYLRAEKPKSEYESLFKAVIRLLPKELRTERIQFEDFVRWLDNTPIPRADENRVAEYLVWLCQITGSNIFKGE